MNVFDSGKDFKIASIKINPRAYRSQHSLPLSGSAMHGESHPDQVFHHLLDLFIRRCVLHGNNHSQSSVVSRQAFCWLTTDDCPQSFTSLSSSVSLPPSVSVFGAISSCWI